MVYYLHVLLVMTLYWSSGVFFVSDVVLCLLLFVADWRNITLISLTEICACVGSVTVSQFHWSRRQHFPLRFLALEVTVNSNYSNKMFWCMTCMLPDLQQLISGVLLLVCLSSCSLLPLFLIPISRPSECTPFQSPHVYFPLSLSRV